MTQTTISVEEATLDRFRELKADLNDAEPETPDYTNDLVLQALMDEWEVGGDPDPREDADTPALDDLHAELRKVQELAEQARDAAQRVEEGMGR